jgi:hypothetical protein
MANLSDRTRKQQVLDYLTAYRNQWVDGPDLATEGVGGSEGLRRLRELRMSGEHDIRERRHPDPQRDIWQYMLVAREHVTPLNVDRALFGLDDEPIQFPEPAEKPVYPKGVGWSSPNHGRPIDEVERESPWPADHGQTPIRQAVRRKEDGTYEYVPPQLPADEQLTALPDDEPTTGSAFERMPTKIDFGEVAICPRCKQHTSRGRTSKPAVSGKKSVWGKRRVSLPPDATSSLVDGDGVPLFKDPRQKGPCMRCNGYGIVPNQGPIALTPPDL